MKLSYEVVSPPTGRYLQDGAKCPSWFEERQFRAPQRGGNLQLFTKKYGETRRIMRVDVEVLSLSFSFVKTVFYSFWSRGGFRKWPTLAVN